MVCADRLECVCRFTPAVVMKLLQVLAAICLVTFCAANHFTHKLNIVWTNRELHSPLAKRIGANQDTCTEKIYYHQMQNSGMGSDFHTWSQALCNSLQYSSTLVQVDEPWIWADKSFCNEEDHRQPLSCYFGMHLTCPNSTLASTAPISWNNRMYMCESYIYDIPSRLLFRAAAIEYLFANLNPKLVHVAEKAIPIVFGPKGIPDNLITVHVRWGDKSKEMNLVNQTEYFNAIEQLVTKHQLSDPHVYITTESKEGLDKLIEEIKIQGKSWKVHHYEAAVYNGNMSPTSVAANSQGSLGLHSLISLLLAMEAKYYIITSGSNWSRVIDELRTTVVDVACGNCTDSVDLREGFFAHNWRT